MRCKEGRHDCDTIIIDHKILNEAGVYWFCDECSEQFMIEYINKFDKNAHFKGFKENYENEKKKENEKTKKDDTAKIKDKKTKKSEKTMPEVDIDIPEEIPKQMPK